MSPSDFAFGDMKQQFDHKEAPQVTIEMARGSSEEESTSQPSKKRKRSESPCKVESVGEERATPVNTTISASRLAPPIEPRIATASMKQSSGRTTANHEPPLHGLSGYSSGSISGSRFLQSEEKAVVATSKPDEYFVPMSYLSEHVPGEYIPGSPVSSTYVRFGNYEVCIPKTYDIRN